MKKSRCPPSSPRRCRPASASSRRAARRAPVLCSAVLCCALLCSALLGATTLDVRSACSAALPCPDAAHAQRPSAALSPAPQIASLPEWAQLAFGGYKSLNHIQSRIYEAAFSSNQNMLVCAPTGAA